jgi:transcriptional regulator with XRE-family HTH domain
MARILDAICEAIEASGQSRYRIAKRTGISQTQLSRLMTGERGLSFEASERLAEYLGLEITVRLKGTPMSDQGHAAYHKLIELIESRDGKMTYRSGGKGGGGTWVVKIWGKQAEFEVRNSRVNDLDALYVCGVSEPETWDDYEVDAPLVDNAFHLFAGLIALRAQ